MHAEAKSERERQKERERETALLYSIWLCFLFHYQRLCPKGQNFSLFFPATILLTEPGKEVLEAVEAASLQAGSAADISEFDTLTTDDEDN